MGAVLGANERDIAAITALPELRDAVFVAVINARDQIVIAGTDAAVARTLEIAKERGAHGVRALRVDVPSHTPFMVPVSDALRSAFAATELRDPTMPFAANVDGRALSKNADIAADLIESVTAGALARCDPDAPRTRRRLFRGNLPRRHANGPRRKHVPGIYGDFTRADAVSLRNLARETPSMSPGSTGRLRLRPPSATGVPKK